MRCDLIVILHVCLIECDSLCNFVYKYLILPYSKCSLISRLFQLICFLCFVCYLKSELVEIILSTFYW